MQCTVLCLERKIEILKRLECYGYSIAYYILTNEKLAADATKAALIEVSMDRDLFGDTSTSQQSKLKKIVMREALRIKINALTV